MLNTYSAKLEKLPEGIQFPAWIEDHLSYDGVRKNLILKNFDLVSSVRDELLKLSAESLYVEAINELYRSYLEKRRIKEAKSGVNNR